MARNVELWARQNAGKSGIFPSRCERWRGPAGPRVASGPSRPGRRMRGGLAHEIASVTGFFRVRAQGSHFGFVGSHFAFLLGLCWEIEPGSSDRGFFVAQRADGVCGEGAGSPPWLITTAAPVRFRPPRPDRGRPVPGAGGDVRPEEGPGIDKGSPRLPRLNPTGAP